ncbi:MAG: hypothetical protein CM15mV128_300 [Caudoviricetes sp.]|nr:MAG: hypothetical protein CM15mV128_300 [Caudoviricetes sp.]
MKDMGDTDIWIFWEKEQLEWSSLRRRSFKNGKTYEKEYLEKGYSKETLILLGQMQKKFYKKKTSKPKAKEVIIELVFNIGLPRTKKFVKCLAAFG